jgi:hypothetical protein
MSLWLKASISSHVGQYEATTTLEKRVHFLALCD